MQIAFCLDCGLKLVLRGNAARSVRRHFKNYHGGANMMEHPAVMMKACGLGGKGRWRYIGNGRWEPVAGNKKG